LKIVDATPVLFRTDRGEARGLAGNEHGSDAESRDEEDGPERPRTGPWADE
jgi:hypothetical protein